MENKDYSVVFSPQLRSFDMMSRALANSFSWLTIKAVFEIHQEINVKNCIQRKHTYII